MNGRAVLFVGLTAVLLAALVYSSKFKNASMSRGKPAPEIAGEDIDGRPMKLSDFRGQAVLLDFWGNW